MAHLLLILTILTVITCTSRASDLPPSTNELLPGFEATPNPSVTSFQPLLSDISGDYSLGFLRTNPNRLTLSVLHVPSSVQLWSANPTRPARWGPQTRLLFNGSLVLSDPRTGVFWSTHSDGRRVSLSNASNLVIQGGNVSWESFDFPTDTLVGTQIFTSAMALASSNGIYSMRLGPNFMGLYAKFGRSDSGQMYLRHGALEAKAEIIEGGPPVYLVLQPDGYLGMYQNGSLPVDVLPFNSFQQNVSGARRFSLEPDGNLRAYFWTGSDWKLDYQAITESCDMPSACGAYGLCRSGDGCSCLDNRTVHGSAGCARPAGELDFCGPDEGRFGVLRRSGVDLASKELVGYERMGSLEMCEGACERNCTCWGVVYSNASGFCYTLDYPVQTLLAVGDETKVGYFKVREGAAKNGADLRLGLGLGLLSGAVLVFAGILWACWHKRRSGGAKRYNAEGDSVVGIGPYKDLGTASFRSIELSER